MTKTRGKVLLIDDEQSVLDLNKARLAKESIECVCVQSAEEAEIVLQNDRDIRLIIADYMLETSEQIEKTKQIAEAYQEEPRYKTISEFTRKTHNNMPHIPIIVLTGQQGLQMAKLRTDKILFYNVLLRKKDRLTEAFMLEMVTSFLESQDFGIFKHLQYQREEEGERVEVTILSRKYPSNKVCLTQDGKVAFEGEHFLQYGNLGDVLENLQDMVLIALKMADYAKLSNLSEHLPSPRSSYESPSDKILAFLMGMTRSSIQRKKASIDKTSFIAEKNKTLT